MNRKWTLLTVAGILLTSVSAAWAMAGIYGKGDPKRPISVGGWPAQITVLANRTDRVNGSWVNGSDTFNYKGNAKTLNQFLALYAATPGITPQVILQNGDGTTVLLPTKKPITVEYDWQLHTDSWGGFASSVRLPLNGSIALKDLKIPANVQLSFPDAGAETPDVKRFLAEHARRQKAL